MKPSSSQNPLFTAPNSYVITDSSSSPPLMSKPEERSKVEWSWEENKVFENAVAEFGAESELLLPTLTLRIPTKTISQLKDHLKALEDDTNMIDSSDFDEIIELLKSDTEDNDSSSSQLASSMKRKSEQEAAPTKKLEASKSIPRQQRKPTPWTKTEHEMFLLGLERYGRGDWRSISRHLVPSRTPTQVASHAQKYFRKLKNPESRPRKDGSFMRTVDDSPKPVVENAQLAISGDNKAP